MIRALIAIVLPNLTGGGAERVHVELAREFVALGYDVEFVLLRKEGPLLDELPPGVTAVGLNVGHFRQAAGPLRRYLRDRRPAFVTAAMWPLTAVTIIAARLSGARPRVLVGEHIDFAWGSRESRFSMTVMKRLGRRLYEAADAVICVSAGVKAALAGITGLPGDQISVVHNPVRAPERTPALPGTDDVTWWLGASHHLLSAGRLTEQKDHATLLQAMTLLPASVDARLLIMGEGPKHAELAALIDALDLHDRVRLGGFTRVVPAFLAKASALVMSSRWEGLPVIIVEALLQGVQVVATDCPSGPSEILDGGRFGQLPPVGDPAALARAIEAALARPIDADALRGRGADFAPRRAAERYLALLDSAFSARSATA